MTEKENKFLGTTMTSLKTSSTFSTGNMKCEDMTINGNLTASSSFECSGLLEINNNSVSVNGNTVLTTGNLLYNKTNDHITTDNSIKLGTLKLTGIADDSESYDILVPKALSTNGFGLVKVSYTGVALIIE